MFTNAAKHLIELGCSEIANQCSSLSGKYAKNLFELLQCKLGLTEYCSIIGLNAQRKILEHTLEICSSAAQECGKYYLNQYKPLIIGVATAATVGVAVSCCLRPR